MCIHMINAHVGNTFVFLQLLLGRIHKGILRNESRRSSRAPTRFFRARSRAMEQRSDLYRGRTAGACTFELVRDRFSLPRAAAEVHPTRLQYSGARRCVNSRRAKSSRSWSDDRDEDAAVYASIRGRTRGWLLEVIGALCPVIFSQSDSRPRRRGLVGTQIPPTSPPAALVYEGKVAAAELCPARARSIWPRRDILVQRSELCSARRGHVVGASSPIPYSTPALLA